MLDRLAECMQVFMGIFHWGSSILNQFAMSLETSAKSEISSFIKMRQNFSSFYIKTVGYK